MVYPFLYTDYIAREKKFIQYICTVNKGNHRLNAFAIQNESL